WPCRGRWRSPLAAGIVVTVLLPLLFVVWLGYAIAATRAAEEDPSQGPPAWRLSGRLLTDGVWASLAVALTVAPFALAWNPLAALLLSAGVGPAGDAALAQLYAHVFALLALALPWGLVALLVLPHSIAAFAASGKPADLFNFAEAVRDVRRDFVTWNVAAAGRRRSRQRHRAVRPRPGDPRRAGGRHPAAREQTPTDGGARTPAPHPRCLRRPRPPGRRFRPGPVPAEGGRDPQPADLPGLP